MSFSPNEPPTLPWPVTHAIDPLGVLSSSGCASVPFGFTRTQTPVVALSPGAPAEKPTGDSKSYKSSMSIWSAASVLNVPEAGALTVVPDCRSNEMKYSTFEGQSAGAGKVAVKLVAELGSSGNCSNPEPESTWNVPLPGTIGSTTEGTISTLKVSPPAEEIRSGNSSGKRISIPVTNSPPAFSIASR